MTLVGEGEHVYEWVEDWAGVPDSENAKTGWAHPGVVVTDAGYIITFHQGQPQVLVFDQMDWSTYGLPTRGGSVPKSMAINTRPVG